MQNIDKNINQNAYAVFQHEILCLQNLANSLLDDQQATFNQVIEQLSACQGKIIVMGMGKSGHIGRKIAATFASTGAPAFFVHPAEASHGDLGMIESSDLLVCISNSGETQELLMLLNALQRKKIKMIAITNNNDSSLAKAAHLALELKVKKEACPHNLAPTSSTTATLVLGDALAIALLAKHGFTANDFALSHPGGSLGKRLLTTVDDIMRKNDDLPYVLEDANLHQAIVEITRKKIGMTAVIDTNAYEKDGQKIIKGIFTDGDLRRLLEKNVDIRGMMIKDIMNTRPKTIQSEAMAIQAIEFMQNSSINQLLITDQNKQLVGALSLHDMLAAQII